MAKQTIWSTSGLSTYASGDVIARAGNYSPVYDIDAGETLKLSVIVSGQGEFSVIASGMNATGYPQVLNSGVSTLQLGLWKVPAGPVEVAVQVQNPVGKVSATIVLERTQKVIL